MSPLVLRSVWKIKECCLIMVTLTDPDLVVRLESLEVGIDPAAVTESYSVGPNSPRFTIQ